MKFDRCSFCKGKLVEGKTEFVAKVGEQIIAIKDVAASVSENCGEAYYTPEVSRKIDVVIKKFRIQTALVSLSCRRSELRRDCFLIFMFTRYLPSNSAIFPHTFFEIRASLTFCGAQQSPVLIAHDYKVNSQPLKNENSDSANYTLILISR